MAKQNTPSEANLEEAQHIEELECSVGHMIEPGKRGLSLVIREIRPGVYQPSVTICEDCMPVWYESIEKAMVELGKFGQEH